MQGPMSCNWCIWVCILCVDHFLTSCKVDILKEIINLQPFILCSSTKNNHQGCATTTSCAPGNFSPLSNKRISFAHLKLTRLSRVDISLIRGHPLSNNWHSVNVTVILSHVIPRWIRIPALVNYKILVMKKKEKWKKKRKKTPDGEKT